MILKYSIFQLLNFLFPHTCVLCRQATHRPTDLCLACEKDLPFIQHRCEHCGQSMSSEVKQCGSCLKHPPPFDSLTALFHYESPISNLIMNLKFHHHLITSRILGKLLARHISLKERPDYIIPVPLHPKRLRERGFNQALEIARPIAHYFHIPLKIDGIKRIRYTQPQTDLPMKLRYSNVKNVFEVSKNFQAHYVVLIDDVVTTGHTVAELAKALKKVGIKKIDVWSIAKTHFKK